MPGLKRWGFLTPPAAVAAYRRLEPVIGSNKRKHVQSYEQTWMLSLQRAACGAPCLRRNQATKIRAVEGGYSPPVDLRAVCLVRAIGRFVVKD